MGEDQMRRLTTFTMGVWRHVNHPDSFVDARFVGYDDRFGEIAERRWMQAAGVAVRTDVVTSSTRAMLAIIRSGIAVGILPDIIADGVGDLRRLSDAPTVPSRPLWMLMHPDVARQPAAREVATWLGRLF